MDEVVMPYSGVHHQSNEIVVILFLLLTLVVVCLGGLWVWCVAREAPVVKRFLYRKAQQDIRRGWR